MDNGNWYFGEGQVTGWMIGQVTGQVMNHVIGQVIGDGKVT